ncbi:MAG: hypothetical protein ACRDNY_05625 [Gaiellaceae bacterium]
MIFEPGLETMPRERLRELQLDPLRALVGSVQERVPLYREGLTGVESEGIASRVRQPNTRR